MCGGDARSEGIAAIPGRGQFQASGKVIDDKLRPYGRVGDGLLDAKRSGGAPFAAIERILPWDRFAASVDEARQLAQPAGFDFLHCIGESYATLRRYAPQFLAALQLRAVPAAQVRVTEVMLSCV